MINRERSTVDRTQARLADSTASAENEQPTGNRDEEMQEEEKDQPVCELAKTPRNVGDSNSHCNSMKEIDPYNLIYDQKTPDFDIGAVDRSG